MLYLVSGGAGSGKSEYAESLVLQSKAKNRIYLATMQAWDEESRRRVERHRAMRKEKDFQTVEQPMSIHALSLPADAVVLLEDLSNLTANECFGGCGLEEAEETIFQGIMHLNQIAQDLIIVTNELFSDGVRYDDTTMRYLSILASLNRRIAEQADCVVEVVVKIPVFWKGRAD